MKSQLWWKWLIVAALTIFSVWLCYPVSDRRDADGNLLRQGKLRYGLDIKGGSQFTMELDREELRARLREEQPNAGEKEINTLFDDAVRAANETTVEIIRNRVDALGTEEPVITKGKDGRIYVQIPGASDEQRARAEAMLRKAAFLEFYLVAKDTEEKSRLILDKGEAPRGYQFRQNLGSVGPCFVRDPAVAEPDARAIRRFGNPGPTKIFVLEKSRYGELDVYKPLILERRPVMTGEALAKAGVDIDNLGNPIVTLAFNDRGTAKFAKVTTQYAETETRQGRSMAIVLDGISYSHPYLETPITTGRAIIKGSFTYPEANDLKRVLNAGALPAPLKMLSKRFVNPTLGEDTIADARTAIVVGVAAVLLFMFVYYRAMGLVADLALVLNFVLLPLCAVVTSGFLSQIAQDANVSGGSLLRLPVLTLPGIAGLLLSVGMAVDANVLIYERTREEVKAGRTGFPSIMAGYQRAFSAIFDGNLTTVLTGVILFIVGTGLVRGFAVTLVAGIAASMFTALFVTKIVFQSALSEQTSWKPRMLQAVRDGVNIPFIANFRKFATVSVVIIVVSLAGTVGKAWVLGLPSVFGVDFTGGARISYSVAPAEGGALPSDGAIRAALQAAGVDDAAPQFQKSEDGTAFLELKTVHDEIGGREISAVVSDALSDPGNAELSKAVFTFQDIDSIGSQVGRELKASAFKAIALATLMMLLYIGFRFEFGFGLGAVVALVHDVLITIGLFGVLPFQFNLTIVAALLTIVGYGVNDTIVLFDRVREELKRDQKSDFPALVNRCVNATLSRTVLTSVTTLLPVLALLVFCSGDIRGFAACMAIGIVTSTFSSVFIAAPVMLAWYHNKRPDFRDKEK